MSKTARSIVSLAALGISCILLYHGANTAGIASAVAGLCLVTGVAINSLLRK